MRLAVLFYAVYSFAVAQDTRVILLGTGTPNPDPEHSGPSVAVVSGANIYIVDAGPGVVRRAAQAGIQMSLLTHAFITHLHSDHTVGLPDLIFTPAVTGRTTMLELYGPPGLKSMIFHVMKAWKQDMDIRLHGLEPAVPEGYRIQVREVKPGEIYGDSGMRVIAFAVSHGSWKHAYGYRFEAKDKKIVISGDTTYSDAVARAASNCDILVHEVYSAEGLSKRTSDWQRYHSTFHTSGIDLGRLAAQVMPKKLVLYHQLPMGATSDEILSEIRQNFTGEIVYGKDLDIIR